jgi:hypothetical protein
MPEFPTDELRPNDEPEGVDGDLHRSNRAAHETLEKLGAYLRLEDRAHEQERESGVMTMNMSMKLVRGWRDLVKAYEEYEKAKEGGG